MALKVIIFILHILFASSLASYFSQRISRNQSTSAQKNSKRSYCDHCQQKLAARDLFPIIGYLLNGGKCRFCHKIIPIWYFWAEILNASLFGLLYLIIFKPVDFIPEVEINWSFSNILIFYTFAELFFLNCLYDFKNRTIPKGLVIITIISALLFNLDLQNFDILLLKFIGGGIGLSIPGIVYMINRKNTLGAGDIFISTAIGLVFGMKVILYTLFLASIYSVLYFSYQKIFKNKSFSIMKESVAFLPFMLLGFITVLFAYSISL